MIAEKIKIKLAEDTISKEDVAALCEWLQQDPTPKLTKGDLTLEYERRYAASCNRKYAVFVNSGSSANLIAIYALLVSGKLKNKKIVVPALSWITTVSPVIQLGLDAILIDCNLDDLSVDIKELEGIFKYTKPAALFLTTILGLVPDMPTIVELCKRYNVILICDNCESQCSMYDGSPIESFGVLSTCSSYYGHFSATIEGGMITTDNQGLDNMLRLLRSHSWLREIDDPQRQLVENFWETKPFDGSYTFYETAFNVRNTEIGAFLGLRQVDKYDWMAERRRINFIQYKELLSNEMWKPKQDDKKFVCNLGYPIIHARRDDIAKSLQENGVECRPLIAGNLGLQPFWVERYGKKNFNNADFVTKYGMYLPNHSRMSSDDIKFICEIVNQFAK